jgi:hypothetical protein
MLPRLQSKVKLLKYIHGRWHHEKAEGAEAKPEKADA